jgi:hypothetical protein
VSRVHFAENGHIFPTFRNLRPHPNFEFVKWVLILNIVEKFLIIPIFNADEFRKVLASEKCLEYPHFGVLGSVSNKQHY